ncbi:CoA transferase [Sphingobium sp. V4]|uniref:CaiB/BaiF CoA transferase family protein n=1 Tax=Sphingobium sp. V4 TaxID=3038927 RepID=UPI002557C7D7|nr:CoA transferase [Sphingobium sp. V4]WIW89497.1 CoA transferase [Sphingobium sp. V4]
MSDDLLRGIRVIEACSNLAGPVAGTILADLGAEVIKVERPEGDDARRFAPPFLGEHGATFTAVNRNKSSIVLDLKQADQLAQLRDLVADADVFLHNMRPGVVEGYGLGPDQARALNPRLIYGVISGYGARGPLRDLPGYDGMAQGLAGLASINGEPDSKPSVAAGGVVDKGAAMWLAMAVNAALFRRERTGQGSLIETSLLETALFFVNTQAAQFEASGDAPQRHGSRAPSIVPADCFETVDGYILLMCGNDRLFQSLSLALGRPDWAEDPLFRRNRDRVANRALLEPQISAMLKTRGRDEIIALLTQAGVPCSAVLPVNEARHHPQVEALGIFQESPGSGGKIVGAPFSIDGKRPPIFRGAPALGEDTDRICGEGRIRRT